MSGASNNQGAPASLVVDLTNASAERWKRYAMSTERCDRERAEAAATKLYTANGKPAPNFIWFDSEAAAVRAYYFMMTRSTQGQAVAKAVEDFFVGRNGYGFMREDFENLRDQVESISRSIDIHDFENLTGPLILYPTSRLALTGRKIGATRRFTIDMFAVESRFTSQINAASDNGLTLVASLSGFIGSAGFSFATIPTSVLLAETAAATPGMDPDAKFAAIFQLAENCARAIPFSNLCFLVDRPLELHIDDRWNLHREGAPAIVCKDGWKAHAIHGVVVPDFVAEQPDRITTHGIDGESNVEVKRVMLERFGYERYLKENRARVIDHDEQFGTLYEIGERGIFNPPILVLGVTTRTQEADGSFKRYFLPVHPELRPLPDYEEDPHAQFGEPQSLTARNAVASTFGLYGHEYAPEMES